MAPALATHLFLFAGETQPRHARVRRRTEKSESESCDVLSFQQHWERRDLNPDSRDLSPGMVQDPDDHDEVVLRSQTSVGLCAVTLARMNKEIRLDYITMQPNLHIIKIDEYSNGYCTIRSKGLLVRRPLTNIARESLSSAVTYC